MPGNFIWLYYETTGEWKKAACDVDGKLEVSGMDFPDDYPLPAAQVTSLQDVDVGNFPVTYPLSAAQIAALKLVTLEADPVISQPTPELLNLVLHGWVAGNGAYLPIQVSAAGKLAIEMTPLAHAEDHDPEDGADPLDTAAPVKVGAANAIGDSHFLSRANHVHEREHAIDLDGSLEFVKEKIKNI